MGGNRSSGGNGISMGFPRELDFNNDGNGNGNTTTYE